MQGQRNAFNSFPEIVDLNQEYISNNNSMDYPTWNDVLNPVESRLPHNSRSFSGWDLGESSSGANLRDHISGDGLKMEHGLSSSYSASAAAETRLEERRFEPSSTLFHDRVSNGPGSNQVTWGPPSMQSSGSDQYPANVNLNARYAGNNDVGGQGIGAGILPSFYKSGRLDAEQIPSASMPSGDVGTYSRNSGYFVEDDDGSGSSLGSWGLSCKRKAVEGTSAQPYPGGNTSFFPQAVNTNPHIVPSHHNASSSLSTSSHAVNSIGVNRTEQLNSRFGICMQGVASDVFPPLSATGTAENSTRNFGARVTLGYQEPVPFNLPSAGNTIRRSSALSSHQSSRSISLSDFLEFRPTAPLPSNSTNTSNQPHLMHGPGLIRNTPLTWNGTLNSGTGSSSSLTLPGEGGGGLREDANFRSTIRNNAEHPMFVPVAETRNLVQDPTNWSLGTGSSSSPGGVASSSRVGPSSNSRLFPTAWLPHHNHQTQNQLRLSDFAPWTPFQSVESEARVSRGHFLPFASGPSSSPEKTVMSSGSNSQGHHQLYSRSALLMEVPGDDVNGWRALVADIDRRQRLIRTLVGQELYFR